MKLKHSPAPWKILAHNWSDTSIIDVDGNRIAFQDIQFEYGGIETTEETQIDQEIRAIADSKLIAAAPELLQALLDMVSDRDCLSDATVNNAKKAIAKALGDDTWKE